MSKMNSEELFKAVKKLETNTDLQKMDLFNMINLLDSIIKKTAAIESHQELLDHLSVKNKKLYLNHEDRIRALKILKFSVYIRFHENSPVAMKQKSLKQIELLGPSADELAYVKIITRSADLGDLDLIVVPRTEDDSNESTSPELEKNNPSENIKPAMLPVTHQKTLASNIPKNWFTDWQDFAATPFGFLFTVGTPIIGVVAFIVLSQFNMDMVGGMVLAGAVFGDIALGFMASKLQKNGFFKCCGVSSDELSPKPHSNFLTT